MSLFPRRADAEPSEDRAPRLVDVDEDAADEVFDALSSATARTILAALHEEPRTASDLADVADTSLQNVSYHLGKLRDADLVEVVDTWYSERGTEMKVYAPADESLVVFAGDDAEGTFRALLTKLLSAVAVVGVAWLALDRLFDWFGGEAGGGAGGEPVSPGSGPVADGTETVAQGGTGTAAEGTGGAVEATTNATTTTAQTTVTEQAAALPPEAVVVAAAVLVAVLYVRRGG
ncbi:MAG: ArsR/SmtB family transcription factor [Halobacteriaceae archaeon]